MHATSHVVEIKLLRDDKCSFYNSCRIEIVLVESDSESNRPQQDPCNCDRFFILSYLALCKLPGSCQQGIQGHLAAFRQ